MVDRAATDAIPREQINREAAVLGLYHHGSSACAAKVRFALAEKQLLWTSHYVDILKGEQFTPGYLAINPKGIVPVLVDQGQVIPESTVICEYIEEAFPENPIYPASPRERARARLWTKIVDEELHPACSAITYIVSHRHTILRNGVADFETFLKAGSREGSAARTLKWQWIQQGLATPGAAEKVQLYDSFLHQAEAVLQNSTWLVGESFSIADIALAPYVNRLAVLAMERMWSNGRLPHVEAWFDRVRERPTFHPTFTEWMPADLTEEMRENGKRSWADIKQILAI